MKIENNWKNVEKFKVYYCKGLEKLNRTDKVTKLSQESDSGQIYPNSAVTEKLTVLNTPLEETVYHTRSSIQNWKELQILEEDESK